MIELIYDEDCPNAEAAREQLLRALGEAGLPPRWQEWRSGDPDAPAHTRGYGSPTVLVDGKDVAGASPSVGTRSCRIYAPAEGEPRGAPPVALLLAALKAADEAAGAPGGGSGA